MKEKGSEESATEGRMLRSVASPGMSNGERSSRRLKRRASLGSTEDVEEEEEERGEGNADTLLASRPKRNIISKNLDFAAGLSWKEENDLKKALYASLQESKKREADGLFPPPAMVSRPPAGKSGLKRSHSWTPKGTDESSQDSLSGYPNYDPNAEKDPLSKAKVHAQRKFAQGSRPNSPNVTPIKVKPQTPRKFFTTKKAKTEDFLTFLCLRGTHLLPPHMDFYNMEDSDENGSSAPGTPRQSSTGSRPGTPGLLGRFVGYGPVTSRQSSPDRDISSFSHELGVRPLTSDDPKKRKDNSRNLNPVIPLKRVKSDSALTKTLKKTLKKKNKLPKPAKETKKAEKEKKKKAKELLKKKKQKLLKHKTSKEVGLMLIKHAKNTANKAVKKKKKQMLTRSAAAAAIRAGKHVETMRLPDTKSPKPSSKPSTPNTKLRFKSPPRSPRLEKQESKAESKVESKVEGKGEKIESKGDGKESKKEDKAKSTASPKKQEKEKKKETPVKDAPVKKRPGRPPKSKSFGLLKVKLPLTKRSPEKLALKKVAKVIKDSKDTKEVKEAMKEVTKEVKEAAKEVKEATKEAKEATKEVKDPNKEARGSKEAKEIPVKQPEVRATRQQKMRSRSAPVHYAESDIDDHEVSFKAELLDFMSSDEEMEDTFSVRSTMSIKSSGSTRSSNVGKSSPRVDVTAAKSSPKLDISAAKSSPKLDVTPGKSSPKIDALSGKSSLKVDATVGKSSPKVDATVGKSSPKVDATVGKSSPKVDATIGKSGPNLVKSSPCLVKSSPKLDAKKQPKKSIATKTTPAKAIQEPTSTTVTSSPTPKRKTDTPIPPKATLTPPAKNKLDKEKEQPTSSKKDKEPSSKKEKDKDREKEKEKESTQSKKDLVASTKNPVPYDKVRELLAARKTAAIVPPPSPVAVNKLTRPAGRPMSPVIIKQEPGAAKPVTRMGSGGPDLPKRVISPTPVLRPTMRESFPNPTDRPRIVDVPTYHPSAESFTDPIAYIDTIRMDAEPFGMCRIIPPEGWKPECRINDDLKFFTHVQYIHRMQNRWGPNSLQVECIKRHLESQGVKLEPPIVGGVELDLAFLYETVKKLGGVQYIINKNKWSKVADILKIPKGAQERTTRLYDIYCKLLLSFDTLDEDAKLKLEQQVQIQMAKSVAKVDCVCKGRRRSRQLGEFFKLSRNLQTMWFKDDPSSKQVEVEYWRIVKEAKYHVAAQGAQVDTKICGSGFPTKKDSPSNVSPYSRHGWNFNILQHNNASILKNLGQISGVTSPTLHISMLFTTCCWSRNQHRLPCIVYNHTGADIVWHSIPGTEEEKFASALKTLTPNLIENGKLWLPEESIMVSPQQLLENQVSSGQVTLRQGEFLIIFPGTFTSSISCGYNISESLHFATSRWLPHGIRAARECFKSFTPEKFSIERLLFRMAYNEKTSGETLNCLLPHLEQIIKDEIRQRKLLCEAGLKKMQRMPCTDTGNSKKSRQSADSSRDEENVCDISGKICYLSMVVNEAEDATYSLSHGLTHVQRRKNLRNCYICYRFSDDEMESLLEHIRQRLNGARSPSKKKKLKAQALSSSGEL